MSIPISMIETAMKMLEDVAMTRIDGLKAEVASKDMTIATQAIVIKCLQERIDYLEEANASYGPRRACDIEEWRENFTLQMKGTKG